MVILFFVLSFASNTANAQTRSYTLGVLQKTDYVIDEANDIVDYFYFNDGEFIAKALYFQDYAYFLYDSRQYRQALQYSLMARSYAVNAIEICEDYWQYYDYYYYGYSPTWGRNASITARIGNVQLHWGLTNALYHNNIRVNWDLYFTTREWSYYRNLPAEIILLNGLYNHRGSVIVFNDRYINRNVYVNMKSRVNTGRDNFIKSNPKTYGNMGAKPKDIKPANAPTPTHNTRRETMNSVNNNTNSQQNERSKASSATNSSTNQSSDRSRTTGTTTNATSNTSNERSRQTQTAPSSNRATQENANVNESSQTRRSSTSTTQTTTTPKSTTDNKSSSTSSSQTTTTPKSTTDNKSSSTSSSQTTRRETEQQTSTSSSSSSSSSGSSSSTSSSRRR
jgi:hypothetical protein